MADSPLLEVQDLRVLLDGAVACSQVTISVGAGEVVALLGANGAGKTTTLRAISGLCKPAVGSVVRFQGVDLTSMAAAAIARIGLAHVPEGRRLFGPMTVEENLELGLYARWPASRESIEPAFELFPELEPLRRRQAYSLSGGEQQMVAVSRALLAEPQLIMMDEPTLGLAPVVVERIRSVILGLRERGMAVLLVEQDTAMAVECCDRGYVLQNGIVAFEGDREALTDSTALTDAYLGVGGQAKQSPPAVTTRSGPVGGLS